MNHHSNNFTFPAFRGLNYQPRQTNHVQMQSNYQQSNYQQSNYQQKHLHPQKNGTQAIRRKSLSLLKLPVPIVILINSSNLSHHYFKINCDLSKKHKQYFASLFMINEVCNDIIWHTECNVWFPDHCPRRINIFAERNLVNHLPKYNSFDKEIQTIQCRTNIQTLKTLKYNQWSKYKTFKTNLVNCILEIKNAVFNIINRVYNIVIIRWNIYAILGTYSQHYFQYVLRDLVKVLYYFKEYKFVAVFRIYKLVAKVKHCVNENPRISTIWRCQPNECVQNTSCEQDTAQENCKTDSQDTDEEEDSNSDSENTDEEEKNNELSFHDCADFSYQPNEMVTISADINNEAQQVEEEEILKIEDCLDEKYITKKITKLINDTEAQQDEEQAKNYKLKDEDDWVPTQIDENEYFHNVVDQKYYDIYNDEDENDSDEDYDHEDEEISDKDYDETDNVDVTRHYDQLINYANQFLKRDWNFLWQIIRTNSTNYAEFCYYCSYCIQHIHRQKSIAIHLLQHKSQKTYIWKAVKRRKFHEGFTYQDGMHSIQNWHSNSKQCTNGNKYLTNKIHVKIPGGQHDPYCALCGESGFKCKDGQNPFMVCHDCGKAWHLHCSPRKLIKYYTPEILEPNAKYFCEYKFRDLSSGDGHKYCCIFCISTLYSETKQRQDLYDDEFLFQINNKYYFRHFNYKNDTDCYYYCYKEHLNTYYKQMSKWWKQIGNEYVNYDTWTSFGQRHIVQQKFQKSITIFQTIVYKIQKKYPILYEKIVVKYPNLISNITNIEYYYNSQLDPFHPIVCIPSFWKSGTIIGSKTYDHLLYQHEHYVLRDLISNHISDSYSYDDNNDKIIYVKPVQEVTENINKRKNIEKYPAQWDFTKSGDRTKNYNGIGCYSQPLLGHSRNKYNLKLPRDVNIKKEYVKSPVLCKLNKENSHWPSLLKLINEFISNRFACIEPKWKKTNQMQINCYGKGAKILNHYDHYSWFNQILLYKTVNNSGIHLSIYQRGMGWKIMNPYLFLPMPEGSFCTLNAWSWTWYKHSKCAWMNQTSTGSITTLFRRFKHNAVFYPYPTQKNIDIKKNTPL